MRSASFLRQLWEEARAGAATLSGEASRAFRDDSGSRTARQSETPWSRAQGDHFDGACSVTDLVFQPAFRCRRSACRCGGERVPKPDCRAGQRRRRRRTASRRLLLLLLRRHPPRGQRLPRLSPRCPLCLIPAAAAVNHPPKAPRRSSTSLKASAVKKCPTHWHQLAAAAAHGHDCGLRGLSSRFGPVNGHLSRPHGDRFRQK